MHATTIATALIAKASKVEAPPNELMIQAFLLLSLAYFGLLRDLGIGHARRRDSWISCKTAPESAKMPTAFAVICQVQPWESRRSRPSGSKRRAKPTESD
jgi:hypothetical protein